MHVIIKGDVQGSLQAANVRAKAGEQGEGKEGAAGYEDNIGAEKNKFFWHLFVNLKVIR